MLGEPQLGACASENAATSLHPFVFRHQGAPLRGPPTTGLVVGFLSFLNMFSNLCSQQAHGVYVALFYLINEETEAQGGQVRVTARTESTVLTPATYYPGG